MTDDALVAEGVKALDEAGETLNVPYVGVTCAACHTAQYNTMVDGKKVGIRVDGAGALSDFEGYLVALTAAMKSTYDDAARWDRFSKAVLGNEHSAGTDGKLKTDFAAVLGRRADFDRRTTTTVKGGFARLDAFTGILNQITEHYLQQPGNHRRLEAPVSYPHVFDTPYYDWIEWNGLNSNNGLGPLGRNVGEVLGSFATVSIHETGLIGGFPNSARTGAGLPELEKLMASLQSPAWPTWAWGELDQDGVQAGSALYAKHCEACHPVINPLKHVQNAPELDEDRKLKGLTIRSVMVPADVVGTDQAYAVNISERTATTGLLQGQKNLADLTGGAVFGAESGAVALLKDVVARSIAYNLKTFFTQSVEALADSRGTQTAPPPKHWFNDKPPKAPHNEYFAYRGRALNGIWATAPYLHNGAVLTLWDLLLPPDQRPKTIYVGSFAFDTQKIGLQNVNICPEPWRTAGSAWVAEPNEPDADFGDPTKTAEIRTAFPDLSRCQAMGYEIDTTPGVAATLGNQAAGHFYGTGLSDAERAQLIEYIKSL